MIKGKKLLIILFSLLLGNLFTDKTLMTSSILENEKQIQLIFLLDTGATGIVFVDEAMAYIICEALEIFLIKLKQLKSLKRFDDQSASPITHII